MVNFFADEIPTYTVTITTPNEESIMHENVIHDGTYPDDTIFHYIQKKDGEQHLYRKQDIFYIKYSAEKLFCIDYWKKEENERATKE